MSMGSEMGLEHYSVTARVLVFFSFYNRGRSFEYLFYYLFPDFPGRSLSSTQFRHLPYATLPPAAF